MRVALPMLAVTALLTWVGSTVFGCEAEVEHGGGRIATDDSRGGGGPTVLLPLVSPAAGGQPSSVLVPVVVSAYGVCTIASTGEPVRQFRLRGSFHFGG